MKRFQGMMFLLPPQIRPTVFSEAAVQRTRNYRSGSVKTPRSSRCPLGFDPDLAAVQLDELPRDGRGLLLTLAHPLRAAALGGGLLPRELPC